MTRSRQHTQPLTRKVAVREPRERFLIVCEGAKTEPNYFRSFRVTSADIQVFGAGMSTLSLVESCMKRRSQSSEPYDQVWCVFDRDSNPADDFNAAIAKAESEQIRVAYSNEAFELWFLLHFDYCDSALSRQDYVRRLSEYLGRTYEKRAPMYDILSSQQALAIEHAKRLLDLHSGTSPAQANPSTTVHLLVMQLQRFMS